MLADNMNLIPQSGKLDPGVQPRFASKMAIVDFITEELPRWRDHPDRPDDHAETKLTETLCDYLNNVARCSLTWSQIQFRTETGDETYASRKTDLTVKPCETLIIENRRHTIFDSLFPVECKRLPTPQGKDRDEREYVTSQFSTTGGIQRFKLGYHGKSHSFAAMIAYVQEQSCSYWLAKVNHWIADLAAGSNSVWNDSEKLQKQNDNPTTKVSVLKSEHQRVEVERIELCHLWIEMQ
jgi:hypothetical protein